MSADVLSSGWFALCWLGFFVLAAVAIAVWYGTSRRKYRREASRRRRRPRDDDE